MPKFEKENEPRAKYYMSGSGIPIYEAEPVPPGVDPVAAQGSFRSSPDALYNWLTGVSKNLPFGVLTTADVQRKFAPKPPPLGQAPSQAPVAKAPAVEPKGAAGASSSKPTPPRQGRKTAPALPFSGYSAYDYMAEAPAAAKGFSGYPEYDAMADTTAPAKNAMTAYKSGAAPMADMAKIFKEAAKAPGASPELAKAAGEIPKTKAGMKKFMQDYGKFIALGAMAGAGGKGGQIAAPIMAALPGLIEMMKGRGKDKVNKKADGGKLLDALESAYAEFDKDKYSKGKLKTGAKRDEEMRSVAKERMERFSPKSPSTMVQYNPQQGSWYTPSGFREFEDYGERKRKSDESEKKSGSSKKSEGGAIRKFKGGSMNMKKDMLTPKYKKGGAAGEMPQHKKMAMGKPTPQSTGQKFAKGGAAKYAGGGMCKGYGISKKIRPTGPMN
jgi:hypothetical protein